MNILLATVTFQFLCVRRYLVSTDSTYHYDDVIMTRLASQITSLTVVYSIVYSGVNQRKLQSSASLAFVREIHRGLTRTNGQLRGKCFHLMTSSYRSCWQHCNALVRTHCNNIHMLGQCSTYRSDECKLCKTYPQYTIMWTECINCYGN